MTATIAIPNRNLHKIPVKQGCIRVYLTTWCWAESYGYRTEEEAENASEGQGGLDVYALDVPSYSIMTTEHWGKGVVFIPKFPDYLKYKVGQRKVGEVTEQIWEG